MRGANEMIYLTVVVGALGVFIAYFQWRTAHQRIVLDLFEKRFETCDQIEKAIVEYSRDLRVSGETLIAYIKAQHRAKFLFGEDVNSFLESRYRDLVTVNVFRPLQPMQTQEYADQQRELHEADKRLVKTLGELEALVIPYMRLDQKMPSLWGPF
jgi:hypothetical protein